MVWQRLPSGSSIPVTARVDQSHHVAAICVPGSPTTATSVLAALTIAADAADFSLRLIGRQVIATGTLVGGVEFGGISGVDRASDGSFLAISDDRGGERGAPRFYRLSMAYDSSGFHGITISQQAHMQQPDGRDFPATLCMVDPEGIRVAPNGNLYWSSEGIWHTIRQGATNRSFGKWTPMAVLSGIRHAAPVSLRR